MKFSHISDTHLGFSQYGTDERENDFYQSFNQMIDISIKDHVDFVILTGDLFHVPHPSGDALLQMANGLKKLKQNEIESFFILGEHDISRIHSSPVPWIYHNLDFARYVGDGEIRKFKDVTIVGYDKIRKSEIEDYSEEFKKLGEKIALEKGHKILMMHQGITEFNKFAGEMTANDLPKNFTYYAMGHLHDKDIREFNFLKGPVAYPGSIESTNNEGIKNLEKGFFEVDISSSEANAEWIKVETRPQFSYTVEHEELSEKIKRISEEISNLKKKPIIELKIRGDEIKPEQIQAQMSHLNELTLRNSWKIDSKQDSKSQILDERPNSIEEELLRVSKDTLNSDEKAEFAIKELLPYLTSNQIDEATEIVYHNYQKYKEKIK